MYPLHSTYPSLCPPTPGYCILNITGQPAILCGRIEGIVVSAPSKIVHPWNFVVVVDSLRMAVLVLFVRDSLTPYVTYVRTYISETYNILNWLHSQPPISTCMQSMHSMCHTGNSFLQNFPHSSSCSVTTLAKLNSIMIVPGKGHGMAKFQFFQTRIWHYRWK